MILAGVHIYPVKSIGGVDLPEVAVEPWGLRNDRRWLALNADGSVLTAREQHRMLGVRATPMEGAAIRLVGLDGSNICVEAPDKGGLLPTGLSRLESVRAAGPEADAWLSRQLGNPVRLGWLDDPRRRTVSINHGGHAGDLLNLSDAGPVLLTSTASLRQLNTWQAAGAAARGEVHAATVMQRFRPSLVVDGVDAPFVEDMWTRVRIGDVEFRFAEHCDRCELTTIDPQTLIAGKEPLRTLARHRQWDHKTWFGVRLIPLKLGTIRVGDIVAADCTSRAQVPGLSADSARNQHPSDSGRSR